MLIAGYSKLYHAHVTLVDGTEFDAVIPESDWDGFYGFLEANDTVENYSSYYEEV